MKILITGASGYLASFVIEALGAAHELTLFDRQPPRDTLAAWRFVQGDITDFDSVLAATANQDAVVHLVALVRERHGLPLSAYCDVMVEGTWNVAQACAENGVAHLVNISSVVADGWPADAARPHRIGDATNFMPGDLFYSLAKKLGEHIGLAYAQAYPLIVTNLRPAVIAGDGANPDPQRPDNAPPHWFVGVHPRDVVGAVEQALTHRVAGTFNVVAARDDAAWDWHETSEKLGFTSEQNWSEIP